MTTTQKETLLTTKIRACIAEHLGLDVESVTDTTHFRDDLGLDLMDILELTILLEEQFTDGSGTDDNDDVEFVGDLIWHLQAGDHAGSADDVP